MSESSPPTSPSRPARAPGAYLRLALWKRFALALTVAAALMIAMVVFVSGHNTDANTSTNVTTAARANRDAEILIAQDQAPHTARLARGFSASAGVSHELHSVLARQAAAGAIAGPVGRARCRSVGAETSARRAFDCSIVAASVSYPYAAVVQTAARRITFCKRDAPPAPSERVPLSPRCLP